MPSFLFRINNGQSQLATDTLLLPPSGVPTPFVSVLVNGAATSTGSATSMTVTWTGVIGATSYTYYINGTATVPTTDNGVSNKTAIFTVTASSRYSVYIKATNSFGSTWSINLPTSSYFSGCICWLDAADQSTVTQTSNNISKWTDKTANAYQFTPPSGTATYTTLSGTAKPINEITLSGTSYL